eukprot:scaffold26508_cov60-Phaeocystis_antarctica.AAC.5
MSDSDDELDALISNVTSRTAPAKKAAPAASVGQGQAQLDKAILGKRGGDGGVDLEAMLKGAKRRDQQREATEQEMVRLAEAKAEDEARELATATTAPAVEAEAAAAGAEEEAAAGGGASREVFVRAPQPLALRPFRATDATDPMLGMLASTDAPAALALVEAGWLEAHYAHRPCPAAVLRWLFALVCYHPRPAAVAGASRALSTLLLSGGAEAPPPAWVPSPAHFVHALSQLGADPAALGAEEAALGEHEGALPDETRPAAEAEAEAEAEHGDGGTSRGLSDGRGAQRSRAAKTAAATAKEAAAPHEEAGGSGGPTAPSLAAVRHNLLHLLELPASCAPLWRGGALPGDAQRRAARWVWRLLLAPHAAPAFLSLQDALGRLLDAPTEDAWQTEWLPWAGEMVVEWEGAGLPAEALLHLCQWLPQTLRGQRLQRRAAHAAMERMLARRQADWASAKEAEKEKERAEAMEVEVEAEEAEAEEAEEVEEAGVDKAAEGKAAAAGGTGGDEAGAAVEEEAEDGTPAALGRLVARLEARAWKFHMSSLHSLLLLLDLALSSDAAAHRGRASDLSALARRLRALKQRVAASKAGMDYHALEVESLLAFLPSKLTHLYGLE